MGTALIFPAAAYGYGPGGSGTGLTLAVSASVVKPGDTITVSLASGPCRPGGVVTINIVHPVGHSAPVGLDTTTASSSGGVPATAVTVPASSAFGNYVVYEQCADALTGGVDVVTAALVVDPPPVAAGARQAPAVVASQGARPGSTGAEQAARRAQSWSPPAGWATPAVRSAVTAAVRQALVPATGGPMSAAPATGPMSAALARPSSSARVSPPVGASHRGSSSGRSSEGVWIDVAIAAGLASLGGGVVALRRRHRTVG